MEYVGITLLAISLTTCVVYKVANGVFGLHLRLRPLLLCAVCAMFISLILPRVVVSMAGLAGTIGVLAVFAFIFAYFVAYYDETSSVSYSDPAVLPSTPETAAAEPNPAAPILVIPDPEPFQPPDALRMELDTLAGDMPNELACPEEAASEEEPVQNQEIELPLALATAAEEKMQESENDPMMVEADFSESPITESPAWDEEECLPHDPLISEEEAEPSPEQEQAPEVMELTVLEAIPDNDNELPKETEQEDSLPALADNENEVEDIMVPEVFDELVDYAFEQLESGQADQALTAFRRALALEPESEAAPWIITQIGNILKNTGAYDEAIEIFTQGRTLPAMKTNAALEQEFINTVAFLRIVKNTLVQHRLGFMPFEQIPADIHKEIHVEFDEWRNLA